MEENILIERLMIFGLTRQEATIYLCLCKNTELTGYEVAKLTGISRSNVYGALSGLADKGAAYVVEGSSVKYLAVPIAEFCENYMQNIKEQQIFLQKNMPKLTKITDGYITIQGYRNIANKISHMIKSCEMRLYIAAKSNMIEELLPLLVEAQSKGRKVVVISDARFLQLDGESYVTEMAEEQIRLITDSSFVLTGDISKKEDSTCLYSGQEHLVTVFKEALRNKIQLIMIENNQGTNLSL
ncbi:MAG: helix-turn-helix domain-containing protein [Eubacteriales bacterium]